MATRPDDESGACAEDDAIWRAQNSMGDYKLKADEGFVPDEQQRMTPERTKRKARDPNSSPQTLAEAHRLGEPFCLPRGRDRNCSSAAPSLGLAVA